MRAVSRNSKSVLSRAVWKDPASCSIVVAGYIASALLVATGIVIGATATSIHRVFQWIMAALGAGVLLPNFLRWYWWRLNGWGFTAGFVSGILASLLQVLIFPDAPLYVYFPIIAGIGLLTSVVVSYLTPPTDEEVLANFYLTVRPAGVWGPVVSLVRQRHPGFAKVRSFRHDLLNVVLGIPWLFSLWVFPMYLVGQRYEESLIYFCVTAVLSVVLYFRWYKPLKEVYNR